MKYNLTNLCGMDKMVYAMLKSNFELVRNIKKFMHHIDLHSDCLHAGEIGTKASLFSGLIMVSSKCCKKLNIITSIFSSYLCAVIASDV